MQDHTKKLQNKTKEFPVQCKLCNKKFIGKAKNACFCSKEHKKEWWNQKIHAGICKICGEETMLSRTSLSVHERRNYPPKLFCSKKCRNRHKWAIGKEIARRRKLEIQSEKNFWIQHSMYLECDKGEHREEND